MKTIPNAFFAIATATLICSCGKQTDPVDLSPPTVSSTYTGEKAVKIKEESIIELLAIKKGVKQSILEHREAPSRERLINDLESLRPRLEYIRMQTAMLPESERRVVKGELAVATNQLKKDLVAILNQSPGDDDLAVEVAHLTKQLSPIDFESMVKQF